MARREPRSAAKVVDLDPGREELYLACLEARPGPDAQEASIHRRRWYEGIRDQGLIAKLAIDESGLAAGMIQCVPVDRSPVLGRDLYVVLCVWVLPRRPDGKRLQGRGTGIALLEAAEAEARARGAKGMAAWGLTLPIWMTAAWYQRRGYRVADRDGAAVLVWKPFVDGAEPPRWPPPTGRVPEPSPGKVVVSACLNGWCQAQNLTFERAKRAAAPFGDLVEVRQVDTTDRAAMLAWGRCDALFVDGRLVRTSPPPSQAALDRLVRRGVARRAPFR